MPVNVFVSFSGRDSSFAQKLLSAFQRQDLEVWDYSREGERIAPGAGIDEECRRRIDAAAYFIALLTDSSCSVQHGYYPQLETSYALARRRDTGKPVVVPVINSRCELPELVGPYRELEGILRLAMDAGSQGSVDDAVRRFCVDTAGIPYRPPFPVDPRIRLIEAFRSEYEAFERKYAGTALFSRADYAALTRAMEQFSQAVGAQPPHWKRALVVIGHALNIIEEQSCEADFYFPLVMQGLCEYELGRDQDAAESFVKADRHPRAMSDGHALAGLALIAWRNEDYGAALQHLRTAEQRSSAAVAWELRFNIICAALATGQPLEFSDDLLRVDRSLLTPEDICKYSTLMGVHLLHQRRYREAKSELLHALQYLDDSSDHSPITWLAECMDHLGETRAALQLLASLGAARKSGELMYRAARLALELADVDITLELYETISADPNLAAPKYLIEYARVLHVLNRTRRMRAICEAAIELLRTKAVVEAEDHFYMGFAYYLLGKHELSVHERAMAKEYGALDYSSL
jgi:tetratricopeptide (TPR) repeat protein